MPESPIVYHGTFAEFKKFDKGMLGSFTGAPSAYEGFFFATNRKVAVSYASDLTKRLREYGTKADLARKEIERITGDSYFTALHKTYLHSYPPDIDKKVFELNDIILKYEDLEAGVESIPMGYDYELDPSGRLIKARLDLKKPFIYDMKGGDYRAVSYYDLIKKAKSGGYDGLIIKNTYDGANPVGNLIMTDIYVAFDESQIKIINNKGNTNFIAESKFNTAQKYARIFGLPEEDIAHASYDIFTGILTVTYGIDKPRYKQKKVTRRATKEFADYFKAPIFAGKSVDYILTAYLKEKGSVQTVRESRGTSKIYYTSSDPVFGKMTIKQFIETEVKERGNYTLADVQNWMRKYGLSLNDLGIWVSPLKWVANRYNLFAEEWDEAKNIPESEMSVYEIKGNEGFIIPESDDGDEGYLFVFNRPPAGKAVEYMVYESGTPAGPPDANEIVNKIMQEIKEKPWTVPQKRAEIVARLKSASDEIDRKIITEIRSFRPLGTLSELGAAMGADPRKGVRIDTIMGATVFDEKRVPSKERVDRWEAEHKTAEIIRGKVPEYAFALEARPNTVTGNFRVVEHAQRLKAKGLLTPEEEKALDALEKYWQDHPGLDREKGYGVWAYNLEIMVPERLIKAKKPEQDALPETTPAGIRAGDSVIHKTAKYTAVVDKVHKNGNADITVTEAKGIPEWEKSIKEGFPIKIHVKDLDTYFEKAAIKGMETKQPWEMTKYEAIQEAAKPLGPMGISWGEMRTALSTSRQFAESLHKDMVKLAIVEGKPVPAEVLKDYPDLATIKKQPWEMTYREFADFFQDVWGGQKFTFAERVGKPLGIQSQAGEPYHMIKGKRIGYSGSLERDRWRLAIVDKALSEGKTVPEDVLTELSESLKHEKEKLGGTGMAEQPGNLYTVKVYELIGVPRPVRELRKVHDNVTLEKVKEIVESSPNYDYDIFDSRGDQIQFIKLFGRSPDYTAWSKKIDEERKRLEMERMPSQEVRDWMKRALGIEDYKGGRHDRIQMLALLIQNSELGNIRSISDAGSMALALGKDLGYGTPPAYGISFERYYAEKIAAETGKEVPIIKSSVIVKPYSKEPLKSAEELYALYTEGYADSSYYGLATQDTSELADSILFDLRHLNLDPNTYTKNILRAYAAKFKEWAQKAYETEKAKVEAEKEKKWAEEEKKIAEEKKIFWNEVKDLKITDVRVEWAPVKVVMEYKYLNLNIFAILENGKSVKIDEDNFKGREVTQARKLGLEYFRKHKLLMIGETVEKNVREDSFLFMNRYEDYVKQVPVPVQKLFEETGPIAGGTPARQILTVTEPEDYYFGTEIEVMQGADPGLEPYFTGTIKRLLNKGELVEVHPEGDPREVSFRVPVDRVNVTRLVTQEGVASKKLYRYYYRNRPPSVGTQPEGFINHESWLPARTAPHGRMAFGWVEYDRPLTPEEISGYELFEDEVEIPKLVRELVEFARAEGIDEAMKELTSEYGRAVWDWLKSQKRLTTRGQKEQIRAEIMRLAGITAAPPAVPAEKPQIVIENTFGIDLSKSIVPYPEINTEELNRRFEALIEKAKSMWSIRDIQGWIDRYNDPRRSRKDTIYDLEGLIKTMEIKQPAIEARYNAYLRSTMLHQGILASPKFMNDEKIAQDIQRNIQVSIDEARQLVPQFRAIAEKRINKEEIESIKETFGIDVEQEAHNLGIDLADYAIIKAGNKVVLQHKTIVQRQYEIKEPKKHREETDREMASLTARKEAEKLGAKPVQSMQDVKQQTLSSIQAAGTVEELQPILKGIGFLPLSGPEKRQVMDAYQNKYSTLMSERPFGAPVQVEKKAAAATPQQLFEAEQRRKLEETRRVSVTPTLTGGAVTAKRLEMFEPGAMEKAKAEADARKRIEQLGLPYEVHPYIKKLASGAQDVMKFGTKRGKETLEDLVLSRYVRFCPPGTIIDNRSMPKVPERWWVYPPKLRACMGEIEKKVAAAGAVQECMVRENIQPAMTESMRSYIQGAQAVRDVIHYFRDNRPPIRGVLYRARDRTYFVEAQDGQVYASMGWDDVSQAMKPGMAMA